MSRIALTADHFKELVCGREIMIVDQWTGETERIILQDIGFDVMVEAIEHAHQEAVTKGKPIKQLDPREIFKRGK